MSNIFVITFNKRDLSPVFLSILESLLAPVVNSHHDDNNDDDDEDEDGKDGNHENGNNDDGNNDDDHYLDN